MGEERLYIKYGRDKLIEKEMLEYANIETLNLLLKNLTQAKQLSPSVITKVGSNPKNDFGTVTLVKIILDIECEVIDSNIEAISREIERRA